jgi:hypothetical protein
MEHSKLFIILIAVILNIVTTAIIVVSFVFTSNAGIILCTLPYLISNIFIECVYFLDYIGCLNNNIRDPPKTYNLTLTVNGILIILTALLYIIAYINHYIISTQFILLLIGIMSNVISDIITFYYVYKYKIGEYLPIEARV